MISKQSSFNSAQQDQSTLKQQLPRQIFQIPINNIVKLAPSTMTSLLVAMLTVSGAHAMSLGLQTNKTGSCFGIIKQGGFNNNCNKHFFIDNIPCFNLTKFGAVDVEDDNICGGTFKAFLNDSPSGSDEFPLTFTVYGTGQTLGCSVKHLNGVCVAQEE